MPPRGPFPWGMGPSGFGRRGLSEARTVGRHGLRPRSSFRNVIEESLRDALRGPLRAQSGLLFRAAQLGKELTVQVSGARSLELRDDPKLTRNIAPSDRSCGNRVTKDRFDLVGAIGAHAGVQRESYRRHVAPRGIVGWNTKGPSLRRVLGPLLIRPAARRPPRAAPEVGCSREGPGRPMRFPGPTDAAS